MNESSWLEAAAGTLLTLWLGALSFFGRRELARIDGKADRDQVERMLTLMERRDEQYREDLKEASLKRGEMHRKMDEYMGKQDTILRELTGKVSRLEGRMNGSGNGQ